MVDLFTRAELNLKYDRLFSAVDIDEAALKAERGGGFGSSGQ